MQQSPSLCIRESLISYTTNGIEITCFMLDDSSKSPGCLPGPFCWDGQTEENMVKYIVNKYDDISLSE